MTAPELGRGALTMIHGSLPHGWTLGEEGNGLTLLPDAEVFGFSKQRRAPPRKGASRDAFLSELDIVGERPQTRELMLIDALTPHVREIRYLR